MDFDAFIDQLQRMAAQAPEELNQKLCLDLETEALRFIDDNFIAQAWEGHPWAASTGTILVKEGHLKGGFLSSSGNGEVRIYNQVRYARTHLYGLHQVQKVKEHRRRRYTGTSSRKKKTDQITTVREHRRNMLITQRQYMPIEGSPSPTFNMRKRELVWEHFKALLK